MADPNQPRTSSDKRWFSDRVILGAGSLDRRGCNSAKRAASRSNKTNSFFDFQGINLIVAFLESQKAGYPFYRLTVSYRPNWPANYWRLATVICAYWPRKKLSRWAYDGTSADFSAAAKRSDAKISTCFSRRKGCCLAALYLRVNLFSQISLDGFWESFTGGFVIIVIQENAKFFRIPI